MVDGECRLDAIDSGGPRLVHATRIVDEHVESIVAGAERVRELADRRLRREVTEEERDVLRSGARRHLAQGGVAASRIAADHGHACAELGEVERRMEADAARGPGDQDRLAADVPGHLDDTAGDATTLPHVERPSVSRV